jgi:XTP/dITP diphosphohydrolase
MQELIFVSTNKGKISEINQLLNGGFNVKGLQDLGHFEEIEETGSTLQENALIKAQTINTIYKVNCFADDSGLMIDVLENQPGVKSARFAGEKATDKDNINKVLALMEGLENRKASFNTVICLIWNNENYFFEGKIEGKIIDKPQGENGFGYDPIFVPNGFDVSFAQMTNEEKNKISHRKIAVQKLINHLNHFAK